MEELGPQDTKEKVKVELIFPLLKFQELEMTQLGQTPGLGQGTYNLAVALSWVTNLDIVVSFSTCETASNYGCPFIPLPSNRPPKNRAQQTKNRSRMKQRCVHQEPC